MSETESGSVEVEVEAEEIVENAAVEEPLAPFAPVEPTETVEPVETVEPMQSVETLEHLAPLEPLDPPVAEKRKFPWRWVGAVLTTLAIGTGCAFAVLAPQRTDLPGLKTASDGRYTFAPLTLPTLAPGQSAPVSDANVGEQHISDIRKLLLSPPEGAALDYALPGVSGWYSRAATVKLIANSQADEQLRTDGWRHTAAIAWKTPDGAETKIWLLQFIDSDAAGDATSVLNSFYGQPAGGIPSTVTVDGYATVSYNRVVKGSTATWYGVTQVHDVQLLIEYTAPASIGLAPFEQEAGLQVELLQ